MNRARLTILLTLPLALASIGCTAGAENADSLSGAMHGVAPDVVLITAERVLRREFGRISVDRQLRTIRTDSDEYSSSTDTGTARELVGAPATMRRRAVFSVGAVDGDTVAWLRVELERQDSRRRAALQPEGYRLTDSPAVTSIERDAATTEDQNTLWTRVGRDRNLERSLLNEIQEQCAPLEGEPETRPARPAET
jgi:hypothetical protein